MADQDSVEMHGKPITILMVEDDAEDVLITKRAFRQDKIYNDFRHVENTRDMFAYLDGKPPFEDLPRPDIILLDINLPGQNGMEALEQLRNNDAYKTIPVVMLTTSSEEEDIAESYGLGANSFISKPVTLDGMKKLARSFNEYWFQIVRIPGREK